MRKSPRLWAPELPQFPHHETPSRSSRASAIGHIDKVGQSSELQLLGSSLLQHKCFSPLPSDPHGKLFAEHVDHNCPFVAAVPDGHASRGSASGYPTWCEGYVHHE